jgi:hypothetical protein
MVLNIRCIENNEHNAIILFKSLYNEKLYKDIKIQTSNTITFYLVVFVNNIILFFYKSIICFN